MNKRGAGDIEKLTLARKIIFFFNVFLALMIITGSSILFQTEIGRTSLMFGFFMLVLTVVLRILKQW